MEYDVDSVNANSDAELPKKKKKVWQKFSKLHVDTGGG